MSDIRLNGKMVSFSRLTLNTNDPTKIQHALLEMLGSEDEYRGTPVIIDSTVPQDLQALRYQLEQHGLQVLAVTAGLLTDQAYAIHLPVLPADQPMQRIQATEPMPTTATAVTDLPTPSITGAGPSQVLIHHGTLRTGQQLLAEEGDIVLIGDVNHGAELIAMGHVHVYGAIKGRVIAGAAGDPRARIFCQSLDAQLLSIAGTYCMGEDIDKNFAKKSTEIRLDDQGQLVFRHLTTLT